MVKINFRLSDIGQVEVALEQDEPLYRVLERAVTLAAVDEAMVDEGACMVIREGRVLRGGDILKDSEEISIFPAISGG